MSFILAFAFLIFLIDFVQNDVNITDSGVIPWKEGDFAIIFYVTLNNSGNRPVSVSADMIKCCEIITDITDVDCKHFQLIGGNMYLEAQRVKNITLPYLNIYSYNRKGDCEVSIKITSYSIGRLKSTVSRLIHFDTSLTKQTFSSLQQVDELIFNHLGHSRIKCKFPDEDPLDSCLPVNCHVKYSGHRGFYSTSMNKCVEIPVCHTKNNINQAYLWSKNQCVDLNNTVEQKNIQEILREIKNNEESDDSPCQTVDYIPSSQKVRCHNGHLNNFSDFCDCDVGWESEKNMDWDDFIPSTMPLHLCTVRVQSPEQSFIDKLKNDIGLEYWTIGIFNIFVSTQSIASQWYLDIMFATICVASLFGLTFYLKNQT